jgi:hypothetical protein
MRVAFGLKAHSGWSALIAGQIASLGKSVGPPWGKDQKSATLAAMVALQGDAG